MGSNLLWLAVSLLLASGVWYIAVTSADPIERRRFYNRPIQFVPSRTAVMTSAAARSANVTIQGSQTTVSSRRAEDIVVRADLSRLGPGTHNVPLVASVARPETDGFRRPGHAYAALAGHGRAGIDGIAGKENPGGSIGVAAHRFPPR